jgi:hypothetical protein
MNIVRESNEQRPFDEVRVGEIFEYCDTSYIKSGGATSSSYTYNAICLEDGIVTYFMDEEPVRLVDADLVIHG